MKKIILISLFLGATNLFAQQQQDSLLVKEISTIKEKVYQQRQEMDTLTKKLSNQNYTIENQSQTISALQEENTSLNVSLDSLSQNISTLKAQNSSLNASVDRSSKTISALQEQNTSLKALMDSLSELIQTNSQNIITNSKELRAKIQETSQRANTQIAQLGNTVGKNRLYWIIATLVTLLLGALIYLFLGKRIKSNKSDVETQIKNAKKSLQEESLKLDGELVKVFQKQLEVIENAPKEISQDNDHKLVLKIADRLTAMETNLYRMEPNTRGLNNLKNLVKSTKENFNAKEYEIIEMLGKEYKEGMEVIANFIPSDKIEKGKRIITQVIKPQVNFKGQKIQTAQIVVSVGQ